jgi:hypothetical protein
MDIASSKDKGLDIDAFKDKELGIPGSLNRL